MHLPQITYSYTQADTTANRQAGSPGDGRTDGWMMGACRCKARRLMAACSGSGAWPFPLGALVQGSATPWGPFASRRAAHCGRQAAAYLRPWGLAARQPRLEPRSPAGGRSRSGAHAARGAPACRPPQPHQSRCLRLELDRDKLARAHGERAGERAELQARERRRAR